MDIFSIFKRTKPQEKFKVSFIDNWKQDLYDENVRGGIEALLNGKTIKIHEDGRGYALALDIKRGYILEYQKMLAERISITGSSIITIELNK
jgi:hypothetical protein